MNPDQPFEEPNFRLLFEGSPSPYLILKPDQNFTIIAVNDRYLKATGTNRSEILGRGLFEVFPDNPDDHTGSGVSDLRISLERVLRDQVQDIMGVQKYDIPRADGNGFEVKYWSPENTPIIGDDGKIAFIIHHVEDITDFVLARERVTQESAQQIESVKERADKMEAEVMRRANEVKDANRLIKATESEMSNLNEKLQVLDRAKTEFFSNVSHEFRTPLTLMLGPIEELLDKSSDEISQSSRTSLEVAHRSALRMMKLVNTLLDFSRIEAGRARVSCEPTNLALLTTDLASNFQSACERAGIGFVVECHKLPEPVFVDRDMWEKIVLNLISNAFKFTLKGSIEVRLRIENEFAELTVNDSGCGIPESELPRLFERFHRVAGTRGRTQEGSGIGLALVDELVRMLGGKINVTSQLGKGSTFTVLIPMGKNHLPEHFLAESTAQKPSPTTAI